MKNTLALFAFLLIGVPALAPAAVIYSVSLDISQLAGQGGLQAYFQFIDSNGVNSLTVDNLNIAPGTLLNFPNASGEQTVDFQAAGFNTLRFLLTFDTNPPSGFADFFGFGLNDGTGSALPTNDPLGTNLLLAIDLGNKPVSYSGTGLLTTAPEFSQVPEPGSTLLAGAGLLAFCLLSGARRRRALRAAVLPLLAAFAYGQTPCTSLGPLDPISGVGSTSKTTVQKRLLAFLANNDNRPDLAYITPTGFAVALNSAQPGIQFNAPVAYVTANSIGLAAADFNGDALQDLAVLKSDGTIEIWSGSAPGTFAFATSAAVSPAPFQISALDLNGDNRPDIATLSSTQFGALRNTAIAGQFGFTAVVFAGGGVNMTFGDRNNDGLPDALLTVNSATFRTFLNSSTTGGPIAISQVGSGSAGAGTPQNGQRMGDVTLDGVGDMVGGVGTQVLVFPGSGQNIVLNLSSAINLQSTVTDVDLMDVNGDSKLDIVATTLGGIRVILNTTSAAGFGFTGLALEAQASGSSEVVIANFSDDTRPDLIASGFLSSTQAIPLLNGLLPLLVIGSPNPVLAGSPLALTAIASPACGTPSGTVTFSRGATTLGTSTLTNLRATLTTTLSAAGIQSVTATFTPDAQVQAFSSGRASTNIFVDSGSCATQLVAQAQVTGSGIRLDRVQNQFVQSVTVRNNSGAPLTGPVSLAFLGLPAGVTVLGASSAAGCGTPAGTPYIDLNVCTGGALAPNASLTTTVRFANPARVAINYQGAVLAGFTPR